MLEKKRRKDQAKLEEQRRAEQVKLADQRQANQERLKNLEEHRRADQARHEEILVETLRNDHERTLRMFQELNLEWAPVMTHTHQAGRKSNMHRERKLHTPKLSSIVSLGPILGY